MFSFCFFDKIITSTTYTTILASCLLAQHRHIGTMDTPNGFNATVNDYEDDKFPPDHPEATSGPSSSSTNDYRHPPIALAIRLDQPQSLTTPTPRRSICNDQSRPLSTREIKMVARSRGVALQPEAVTDRKDEAATLETQWMPS
jgi:hypothetical protein